MSTLTVIGMLTLGILGFSIPATAEERDFGIKVRDGGVSGTLINASVPLAPGESAVVYTVPDDNVLVITSVCTTGVASLIGDTLGMLTPIFTNSCSTITPGLLVPSGEVLTCESHTVAPGPRPCIIVGILVK